MLTSEDPSTIDAHVRRLWDASNKSLSIQDRVILCRTCLDGLVTVANDWAVDAARQKGCAGAPAVQAEDLLSGPGVIARQLQLTMQTLRSIERSGQPHKFHGLKRLPNGQLSVPVFPTTGFFDSLTFFGLSAFVRMQPGVDESNLHGDLLTTAREGQLDGISAVMGAGNVSSIPALDSLNRIMFDGRRVVLKMNPVNEYLAPYIRRAFACLIDANLLAVVTGGAEIGQQLVAHDQITDVHVTGSSATHDSIVWGPGGAEREERKRKSDPVLKKPVTSELGNVTPWIIVPGQYSKRQLRSQAEHVAASITNNASFNCLATKVIVTWEKWEQRREFLQLVNHFLSSTPLRPAYYPGAVERFQKFAASTLTADAENRLPWTLLTNQSLKERPELFQQESFVCVCAETQLGASSEEDFLSSATAFVNEQLAGTLCASVTFPAGFEKRHRAVVDECLNRLRYGSICINQWSGLAYGLISPPWGAYPGATIDNVTSGIGSVHNTYLLSNFEKTILRGPLISFPKPIWFPSHRNGLNVAANLLSLYDSPSVLKLPRLFLAALRG